jgi:hypothetical protein
LTAGSPTKVKPELIQDVKPPNRDFLHDMHYRYVHEIDAFNSFASRAIHREKPTKQDFSEVIEKSNLIILN